MRILVTGGASGLGRAVTKALAVDHDVYFTFRSSASTAQGIAETYSRAKALRCDLTVDNDVAELAQRMPELDIDVLVNNAICQGIYQDYFHKLDPAVFQQGFEHNLLPLIRVVQAAVCHFRRRKFGKLITILSAGLVGKPPVGWSEYVATRAYLESLSKSWAIENAPFNITANCVSPALMATKLTAHFDGRMLEELTQRHPLKRLLLPEEVAQAVVFLVGASQQVNGTNIVINAAADVA